MRWLRTSAGVAAIALLIASTAAGATKGTSHLRTPASTFGQISFYADLGNAINIPYRKNPLVVRPATIFLFEDGSWTLEHLHWSGWGTSVARATGISSASTGVPNNATAPRIDKPARFTLTSPGRELGHQVYRCYQLTVPSHPSSDQHDCLKRVGKLIAYSPVTVPKSNPAPKSKHVGFYTPSRNIYCGMTDDGSSQSITSCEMLKPPAIASLFANGRVTIRQGAREVGNPGEGDFSSDHLLPYGSSATAGRFRCKSAFTGVTCIVIKTGKGFFISRQSVRAVG